MHALLRDFRHGLHLIRRSPGLSTSAVLALALGIGPTAALFTVIDGVLLTPLPYHESDRLIRVFETNQTEGVIDTGLSPPAFDDVRRQITTLAGVAAYSNRQYDYLADEASETLRGAWISAEFFDVLGIQPIEGRTFTRDEELSVNRNVFLISEGLSRRKSLRVGDVIRTGTFRSQEYEILGVMPSLPHIEGQQLDVWQPIPIDVNEGRNARFLSIIGRLASGATVENARAELDLLGRQLEQAFPGTNRGWATRVVDLQRHLLADSQPMLLALAAAVVSVLLIACASVANLLLSRAVTREREIAVRVALGGSRFRILRQLVSENLPLALAGGVAGLLLAAGGLALLVPLIPDTVPTATGIGMNLTVLAFTVATILITTVLFSLAPALHASRPSFAESLSEGGRGKRAGVKATRPRGLLAILQIGVALALLFATGLLLRSMLNIQGIDLGFQPAQVLTVRVRPDWQSQGGRVLASVYQRIFETIGALPQVTAVGGNNQLPFAGAVNNNPLRLAGATDDQLSRQSLTGSRVVAGDYFQAMGIPLIAGTFFDPLTHDASMPRSYIVDERVAQDLGVTPADLIDRELLDRRNRPFRVVGVVGHVRGSVEGDDDTALVYWHYLQVLGELGQLRLGIGTTADDPLSLMPDIRRSVLALDPRAIIDEVQTMEQVRNGFLSTRTFTLSILAVFAGFAVLLAAAGVYGVLSASVVQRTRELGLRRALGAGNNDLVKMVVGDGMKLVAVGLALGVVAAFVVGRLLTNQLYGVVAFDPLTAVAMATVVTGVALVACMLPARRAMAINPMDALRRE
jgi:putative ABC transport system permease protein